MTKQNTHRDVVDNEQADRTDDAAYHRVVFTDDCVLYGIRQGEQDHQVEWIELCQFSFPGETQSQDQKNVDDYRPKDFFYKRDVAESEQVFPHGYGSLRRESLP